MEYTICLNKEDSKYVNSLRTNRKPNSYHESLRTYYSPEKLKELKLRLVRKELEVIKTDIIKYFDDYLEDELTDETAIEDLNEILTLFRTLQVYIK